MNVLSGHSTERDRFYHTSNADPDRLKSCHSYQPYNMAQRMAMPTTSFISHSSLVVANEEEDHTTICEPSKMQLPTNAIAKGATARASERQRVGSMGELSTGHRTAVSRNQNYWSIPIAKVSSKTHKLHPICTQLAHVHFLTLTLPTGLNFTCFVVGSPLRKYHRIKRRHRKILKRTIPSKLQLEQPKV